MKKIIITIGFFLVILSIGTIKDKIIDSMIIDVEVTYPKLIEYTEKVVASGTLESADCEKISFSAPVVASEIFVKEGDSVHKGDKLFAIDKSKTVLAASSLLGQIPLEEILENFDTEIENLPNEVFAQKDGIVSAVYLTQGDIIQPQKTLMEISAGNELIVRTLVGEKEIAKVKPGMSALISGTAFKHKNYLGEVTQIAGSAKKFLISGSMETVVETLISIKDPDDAIKSGFTASVNITTTQPVQIAVIPYECILQNSDGEEYVLVVTNGVAEEKKIKVGIETEEGVQIVSGIKYDDKIIVSPIPEKIGKKYVRITSINQW